jgi:glucokinase
MNILCGDIGGTKTRLAIFHHDSFPHSVAENTYTSISYSSLSEMTSDFLSNQEISPACAAFGIAGPVSGRICKTTNLPWEINADQMEHMLQIPSIHLINDLEATAYGVSALDENDFFSLQEGEENATGNCTVIAAGTGLGQAGMFWDGSKHIPFATEGGHCDFAPNNKLEFELLLSLKRSDNRVCWEDILSGPGLVSIYTFLLDWHQQPKPKWLINSKNPVAEAKTITTLANDNHDQICTEALVIFSQLYGAESGNLALKQMATGGVYLGGGIAPKILKWLKRPQFLEAFHNKGKMRKLMESIPVRVILNDRAALYGAAVYLREYTKHSI